MLVLINSGDAKIAAVVERTLVTEFGAQTRTGSMDEILQTVYEGSSSIVVLIRPDDDVLHALSLSLDDGCKVAVVGRVDQKSQCKSTWAFYLHNAPATIIGSEIGAWYERSVKTLRDSSFLVPRTSGVQNFSTEEREFDTSTIPVAIFGGDEQLSQTLTEHGFRVVAPDERRFARVGIIYTHSKTVEQALEFALEMEHGIPSSVLLIGKNRETVFLSRALKREPEHLEKPTLEEVTAAAKRLAIHDVGPRCQITETKKVELERSLLLMAGCVETDDPDFVLVEFDDDVTEGTTVCFVDTDEEAHAARHRGIDLVLRRSDPTWAIQQHIWHLAELARVRHSTDQNLATMYRGLRQDQYQWLVAFHIGRTSGHVVTPAASGILEPSAVYTTRDRVSILALEKEPTDKQIEALMEIRKWQIRRGSGLKSPNFHPALIEVSHQKAHLALSVSLRAAGAAYSARSEKLLRVSVSVSEHA